MKMKHSIPELIKDLHAGKMVILVDDEDRENEGDLVMAADHISPEAVNFMTKHARGLVCLTLTAEQVNRLQLPLMVRDEINDSANKTAFTVSIEAAHGVTTGISAADRAHTMMLASRPEASSKDIVMPGHVFPIRAQKGGVLKRAGHTEGSIDLVRLAGLHPAAVICEIMNDDGTMARNRDLEAFSQQHNLKIGSIVDLIEYRLQTESLVELIAAYELSSFKDSSYRLLVYRSLVDNLEHFVLQKGHIPLPNGSQNLLVRVQSDQGFADVARRILRPDQDDIQDALTAIEEAGQGILLLLQTTDSNRSVVSALEQCLSTPAGSPGDQTQFFNPISVAMDQRSYGVGAQILRHLGVHKMVLLTEHPVRLVALRGYGLEIVKTQNFRKPSSHQIAGAQA